IDLSKSFIEAARTLQSEHKLAYDLKLEGDLQERRLAEVDPELSRRVTFRQADACALPADLLDFDAVLLANLLCRLPSPAACLGRLDGDRGLVKPGGIVVVVSPYTWMERFTPREVWLGGYQDDEGREHYSEEGLQAALGKNFDLLDKHDMPLLIREHERKYQYIVSQAMVFRRRL
ncbi:MAG TPA: methyltransferase domain-containing protein, partial [Candidatus Obscuribacter sp.]|nr:methyltransferase domain-containing protein [Candidatus Obscuribacter sp.]